jgi:hypothetical protein
MPDYIENKTYNASKEYNKNSVLNNTGTEHNLDCTQEIQIQGKNVT